MGLQNKNLNFSKLLDHQSSTFWPKTRESQEKNLMMPCLTMTKKPSSRNKKLLLKKSSRKFKDKKLWPKRKTNKKLKKSSPFISNLMISSRKTNSSQHTPTDGHEAMNNHI